MKNVISVFCLLFTFLAISCKSDDEQQITSGLKTVNLVNSVQSYPVDLNATNQVKIETDAGCKFTFSSKGFTFNGEDVTGDIHIDIIEIFDKGTMAITGKHTMTEDSILISGGEFYVQARQEDNDLDYKSSYQVEVPSELSGTYALDMQLFTGGEEIASTQNWVSAPNISDFWGVFNQEDSSSYLLYLSEFQWFNCDRFYDDPRPLIDLDIKVPSEFTTDNSDVFLAIQNEKSSLGIAARGKYPKGLDVHLIFVSETDDQFLYQIISTAISEDEYKFERDKMQTATPDELKDIINSLK